MVEEILNDIKKLRDEMVQANWPAQRLSNIILKYEMKMKEDPIERFKQREKEEVRWEKDLMLSLIYLKMI